MIAFEQVSLNWNCNKPCNVIKFKDTMIMVDCSLDQISSMCFLPLPLVSSSHFNSMPNWIPNTYELINCEFETELKECSGRVFVDSSPEFVVPQVSLIAN